MFSECFRVNILNYKRQCLWVYQVMSCDHWNELASGVTDTDFKHLNASSQGSDSDFKHLNATSQCSDTDINI